jgi:glutathione S-transferase
MRLLASPTSPYARKVRIVALEKGLMDRLTVEMINPLDDDGRLAAVNPLGKVPALVLDSGAALFDSGVICEYLDQLDGAPTLLPPRGAERFEVLAWHALAQGVLDAALNIVMERRRPEAQQSPLWLERWSAAIVRGLEALDRTIQRRPDDFDLGAITTACALGYLEFRLPDLAWPESAEALKVWWDQARQRPSVSATAPVA